MLDEQKKLTLPITDNEAADKKAKKKVSEEVLARRKRKAEMKRTKTPPGTLVDPIPPRETYEPPLAKLYCGTMYDIQDLRITTGNRILALETTDKPLYDEMSKWITDEIYGRLNELEFRLEEMLASSVSSLRIMEWLHQVPQIGPRLGGSVVGGLKDIRFYETVAAMWAQCGMDVVPVCTSCNKLAFSGEAKVKFLNRQTARRWATYKTKKHEPDEVLQKEDDFRAQWYVNSEKKLCSCSNPIVKDHAPDRWLYTDLLLTHSPFMKMTCWKIGLQFIKSENFYQRVYKEYYAHYFEIWPHKTKNDMAHIGLAARRVIVKLFLSHLWEMWRRAAGLLQKETYVQWKMCQGTEEWATSHKYIDPPYQEGLSW